jgi:hypothetical protein
VSDPTKEPCFVLNAALSPPTTPELAVGSLRYNQIRNVALAVPGPVSVLAMRMRRTTTGASFVSDTVHTIGVTLPAVALFDTASFAA